MAEEEMEFQDNDVRSVFVSILQDDSLDIREKKSAIIDFISAGIETVNTIFGYNKIKIKINNI